MEAVNLIVSSIIVVIAILLFVRISTESKLKSNKAKLIIAILITIILNIFAYKYTSDIYKTIISLFIYLLLITNVYQISVNKSIFCIIVFIILLMIPDFLFLFSLTNIFGYTKEYCYEVVSGSIISNLIVYSSMLLLSYVFRKKLRKIFSIKIKTSTKIIIFSLLTLISILVFFYDIIASFRVGSKIIFYVIAIITFVISLIIVIYQESKNSKLKTEYNKLLEFMETYEMELEQQRILKHEYKNQLITIKSKLIDNDRKNKVIDYIDDILGDNKKFEQEEYTKLQYLPANGIKALFYFKISEAKNKGINVGVNISSSIKNSILNKLTTKEFKDLGILIGVYLDNAIEASIKSTNKKLGIEIYTNEEGISIIISNSYDGTVEENKIGKTPFSTKGKGRGYGLMLVSNTLRNNKKFRSEREITNSLYIQTIIIKK